MADVGERDKRLNRFVNFLARTVGSVQAVAAIYTQISSRSAYACGWSTNSLMLNPLRKKRGALLALAPKVGERGVSVDSEVWGFKKNA